MAICVICACVICVFYGCLTLAEHKIMDKIRGKEEENDKRRT